MSKKVCLCILDGWGLGKSNKNNAIHIAKTPTFDAYQKKYPSAKLFASGEHVGLPKGQMGNSEVGHLNIGAGRVVYQNFLRINNAIDSGAFQKNNTLHKALEYAKRNNKNIHFLGLVSEGGIHSHINHLKALCEIAERYGNYYIHAFLDGRDTDPKSGHKVVQDMQNFLSDKSGYIASIIGRFYAMDRDNRWARIKKAYDMLLHNVGEQTSDVLRAISSSYDSKVTDEFVEPIINTPYYQPILPEDVVIFFNFRTDRCRQILTALTQKDLLEQGMKKLSLRTVTMTNYSDAFRHVEVMFDKEAINNTLGEVLEQVNKKQLRIAETEKYPHVTFFFSGGREHHFSGEERILIPSPKVKTYDLTPEMSAYKITKQTVQQLDRDTHDFVVLNFSNPDMVGHTGNYEAIIKALEATDNCLRTVVESAKENNYSVIITADHGNPDVAINKDGSPNTAHTTNLVPIIVIDDKVKMVRKGKLGDIAPTILKIMDIPVPKEMTGESLI